MKKFITIITVLISSFFFSSQVNALEYYEKIEFKTAFEESVKTEEIKSIGVAMAVDPTPQGEQYYNFDVELLIEENYYYVFSPQSKEKVLLGELFYNGILVDVDAGGTKYETEVNITYPTAKTAVVQVLIYPKDVTTTKSTASKTTAKAPTKAVQRVKTQQVKQRTRPVGRFSFGIIFMEHHIDKKQLYKTKIRAPPKIKST